MFRCERPPRPLQTRRLRGIFLMSRPPLLTRRGIRYPMRYPILIFLNAVRVTALGYARSLPLGPVMPDPEGEPRALPPCSFPPCRRRELWLGELEMRRDTPWTTSQS